MRLNFASTATLFADEASFPDPWGVGVTFLVRRWNSREHQDWLRDRERRHPVSRAVNSGVIRRVLAARKPKDADTEIAANGNQRAGAAEAEAPKSVGEFYQEVLDEAVAGGDLDPADVAAYVFGGGSADVDLDEALSLLAGWEGVVDYDADGAEVPFKPRAARAALSDESVVESGRPYAGQTVGAALVAHIRDCSKQIEAYRLEAVEGASGNSGRGSGSAASSGPRSMTRKGKPSRPASAKADRSPN